MGQWTINVELDATALCFELDRECAVSCTQLSNKSLLVFKFYTGTKFFAYDTDVISEAMNELKTDAL